MDYGIKVSLKNGIRTIQFNNLQKKNSLVRDTFIKIAEILNADAADDEVFGIIFTGTGDYFTSGNDISGALKLEELDNIEATMNDAISVYQEMIEAMIRYPKLLVAVINGPAIGIGVTMCGLCDLVYATENATFATPFVNLGITIEGCASSLFPRIMGLAKANEMILFGRTFTAQEALYANLISRIIPVGNVAKFMDDLHEKIEKLNLVSFIENKKLMKEVVRNDLFDTTYRECLYLDKSIKSENFLENVILLATRKCKL